MKITAEADAYLRSHLWGTLTTIRSSGPPQVSMVAYQWDGKDVVISCRSGAAKFINASQRPDVAFAVADDVDCLTLTGTASCHSTGPDRDGATERVLQALADGAEWGAAMLDADIKAGLDQVGRVSITISPTDIRLVQPLA